MSPNFNPDLRPNVKNRKFAGIKSWILHAKTIKSQSIVTSKSIKKSLKSKSSAEVLLSGGKSFLSKMGDKIKTSIQQDDDHIEEHEDPIIDQRATLIDNYGVTMEFPAFYYYNAKFVPNQSDHLLIMEFHIIPDCDKTKVQTTFQDGSVQENLFRELYDKTG